MITGITVIMNKSPEQFISLKFRLQDVIVRPARPDEFPQWDKLMNEHHYLGFKKFVGNNIRYVAEHKGIWLAIAGWHTAAFMCAPRDQWIGWNRDCQFKNLHLIANNTRFLVLAQQGDIPNLASFFMGAMTRRISDDWTERFGHELLLAESFVDPGRFDGAMYKASNWICAGTTRGYSRSNGQYSKHNGNPKKLYLYELRKKSRKMLRNADTLGERYSAKGVHTRRSDKELMSLYQELECVGDFRRAQGRRHTVACLLAIYILAFLSRMRGPVAAAQYAKNLSQRELEMLGAWYNKKKQRFCPPSKSTMHKVISSLDTQQLEDVIRRYSSKRLGFAQAVAIDGKRIRGANRNGEDHYEVVTLVEHASGFPVASIDYREEGGEIAAALDLISRVDVRGQVITLDALHTTKNTAKTIVNECGADYVFTVKGNSPLTCERLSSVDWERDATGHFTEKIDKAHGRIEQRSIDVMDAHYRMIDYEGVRQVFRVRRWSKNVKSGEVSEEYAYGITSVDKQRGSAQQLLAWNRGHWGVETKNHYIRDVTFGEDSCSSRVGNAPANNAVCANIALAVIFQRNFRTVPEALRHFTLNREEAFEAVLSG